MDFFPMLSPEETQMYLKELGEQALKLTWRQKLVVYLVVFLMIHATIVGIINLIGFFS